MYLGRGNSDKRKKENSDITAYSDQVGPSRAAAERPTNDPQNTKNPYKPLQKQPFWPKRAPRLCVPPPLKSHGKLIQNHFFDSELFFERDYLFDVPWPGEI